MATVANSCSTMHKIQEKEFTLDDFSCEHLGPPSIANLKNIIKCMNDYREEFLKDSEKHNWWQMIQLLPSSYNQTRNVMMNYEVLANIYKSRKDHKLDEWRELCAWIETLPYSELIVGSPSLRGLDIGKAASDGIREAIKDYIFPFKDNYKEDL